MRPHSYILALTLCLAASCGRKSAEPTIFSIVNEPPQTISHQDQLFFQFTARGGGGATTFELLEGPPGLTIDEAGLLHWRPGYSDLGTHPIRMQAASGNKVLVRNFNLRVSQGFQMGITDSPREHLSGASDSDRAQLFTEHEPYGRMISFDGNWRDAVDADGELPQFVQEAFLASQQHGFHAALGLKWSDSEGAPDLTSESEPTNNSWSNAETRSEFLDVVEAIATEIQPLYLYLGHETNHYYLTHTQAEWDAWLLTLEAAYTIVRANSPDTVVYTVFQLERMKGLGAKAGWTDAPHFQLVDELQLGGYVDAVGFTSHPFYEFTSPADLPLGYYEEIPLHWNRQVLFSELSWPAAPAGVFSGSDAEQLQFLSTFFDRVQNVPVEYVVWLFLHDGAKTMSGTVIDKLGMRSSDGTEVRPLDSHWREAVSLRHR